MVMGHMPAGWLLMLLMLLFLTINSLPLDWTSSSSTAHCFDRGTSIDCACAAVSVVHCCSALSPSCPTAEPLDDHWPATAARHSFQPISHWLFSAGNLIDLHRFIPTQSLGRRHTFHTQCINTLPIKCKIANFTVLSC